MGKNSPKKKNKTPSRSGWKQIQTLAKGQAQCATTEAKTGALIQNRGGANEKQVQTIRTKSQGQEMTEKPKENRAKTD